MNGIVTSLDLLVMQAFIWPWVLIAPRLPGAAAASHSAGSPPGPLQPCSPAHQPPACSITGVSPSQEQSSVFACVECQVPALKGSPALQRISHLLPFCVVCKLDEGVFHLLPFLVVSEHVREDRFHRTPLGSSTCNPPPG